MGIDAQFSEQKIQQFLDELHQILSEEIIRALSYLGEQCVRKVRDRPGDSSWFDQTGNLRSSIGYAVYEYGETVIQSAFEPIRNGGEGSSSGKQYIQELASKYAETYALVVVAGMEYADYVEAMNGKDVLASTDLWAKGQIEKYLKGAIERAERRIVQLQKQYGLC